MKWPWEKSMKNHKQEVEEAREPAQEEIRKGKEQLKRVGRIMQEAQQAEKLVRRNR